MPKRLAGTPFPLESQTSLTLVEAANDDAKFSLTMEETPNDGGGSSTLNMDLL